MIIQTEHKLKIGEIIRNGNVSDQHGDIRPLTFQVIRESDEQEFRRYCAEFDTVPVEPLPPYFYLVSAD